ncbi:MAG: type II toxin-antitoxin system VapC family toxin, partial [Candidatus Syntrophonatronum acetioxidans]
KARKIITNVDSTLFLSAASGWEIAIKARLGKITLPDDITTFIYEQISINAIKELPIKINHTLQTYLLPDHHQDPFDRILVSQSQLEMLPIITGDSLISHYNVKVIW